MPEMTIPNGNGRSWPPRGFSKPPQGSQLESRENTRWQQPQPQLSLQSQSSASTPTSLSDVEKKRLDLQMRVWRARYAVPPHIPIRIFREPEECVEVNRILDHLQVRVR